MLRKPEKWFVKELQLIHPDCYPHWSDKHNKWFIVRDFPVKIPGITDYDPRTGKNFVVEFIVKDRKGNFMPLTGKVLRALRQMKYEKETQSLNETLNKIDEDKRRKRLKLREYQAMLQHEFANTVYRLDRTKTFH